MTPVAMLSVLCWQAEQTPTVWQVLDALNSSKEAIQAGRTWFLRCEPHAAALAAIMAERSLALGAQHGAAGMERQLQVSQARVHTHAHAHACCHAHAVVKPGSGEWGKSQTEGCNTTTMIRTGAHFKECC